MQITVPRVQYSQCVQQVVCRRARASAMGLQRTARKGLQRTARKGLQRTAYSAWFYTDRRTRTTHSSQPLHAPCVWHGMHSYMAACMTVCVCVCVCVIHTGSCTQGCTGG